MCIHFKLLFVFSCWLTSAVQAQYHWTQVKEGYGELPDGFRLFKCTDSIEQKPSVAFYAHIRLADRDFQFMTDTTRGRRITPLQYYERNTRPLLVVNGTFFDAASNNLNIVVNKGMVLVPNIREAGHGKDSSYKITRSAIGISPNGTADVAWIYSDTTSHRTYAFQKKPGFWVDNSHAYTKKQLEQHYRQRMRRWKMQTAIGGGPVLVQDGKIMITNDEERLFTGHARHDRHPRTAMGYTADGYLVILVVEGRNKGIAEGASLVHLADMLIGLGCVEAVNLDGGGSSCMLVNGKQTIKPSDVTGQRPVPAVFIVRRS